MKRIKYLLILVFMMGGVLGIEGVSPGSYEVDFEPGLERDFVFDFVLNDKEELRVLGELSEYVVLNKESFFGGEVVVSLKLPTTIEDYGVNNIWILAGDVAGIIKVRVPYPEKYVELSLAVPNANVGEEVSVNLKVSNFGSEGILVKPIVEVYFSPRASSGMTSAGPDDSDEPEEELVGIFEGEEDFVGVFDVKEYEFSFDSANHFGGEYFAVARIDNDGELVEVEDSFRLGVFELEILDYTREFESGNIERFEIEVESLSDDGMKEVYAEVRGVLEESGFVGFDSSIVSLSGWEKKVLVGYVDTRDLEGNVSLVINVHYDGKVESEVVNIYVEKKSSFVFWIVSVFVLVGFFVWNFFKRK